MGHIIEYQDTPDEKRAERLRKLWQPLPLDHPRTQAWIAETYRHFKGGYVVPGETEYGRPAIDFGPSAFSQRFGIKKFADDSRFSDEWRTAEKAAIEQYNAEVYARWQAVAVPENYKATLVVQGYYPEFQHKAEWVANPPEYTGSWWRDLPERPTPDNCPGDRSINQAHEEGKPCQCCGRGYKQTK
jgi:hypothetical protein